VVCGLQTLVMGILNATPDSFSDGGEFMDPEKAAAQSLQMIAEGADIIDVGGESTRPGAEHVSAEAEMARVVPVIEKLRAETEVLISIDTQKAKVARAAVSAGADIINDVSALADPGMAELAAETGAGLVLMHMQGTPGTMQAEPHYDDVVVEVKAFLAERIAFAEAHGVARGQIAVDPGIGFGKTDEHNFALLRGIPELAALGCPVLIGVSRKSFIGRLLGGREVEDRLAGSLAAAVFAMERGAQLLRVHDVIESCDAARLVDTLRTEDSNE